MKIEEFFYIETLWDRPGSIHYILLKWTESWWCRYFYSKKSARDGKAPSNNCCIWWHIDSSVTDVSLVLHNEGHHVRYDQSVNKKKVNVEYSVRYLVNKQPLPPYLFLAHVWTGCDTNLAIQNQGKLKIFQELKSFQVQESVSCFGGVFATPDVWKSLD